MPKSSFEFALKQCVTVPGTDGRQGEVMRRTESVEEPPNYKVHWQKGGRPQSGWFSEAELSFTNKSVPILDMPSDDPVTAFARAAAKTKRKPARKSKSKRKRK